MLLGWQVVSHSRISYTIEDEEEGVLTELEEDGVGADLDALVSGFPRSSRQLPS